MLTAGSLFSGVGMFDYAFAVAGFDILFQVEIDAYCQKVLKYIHDKKTKTGVSSSSAVEMLIRELIELKKETLPVIERAS